MNNPLGVSPSKGKQGTTRGKEKIFDLGGNRTHDLRISLQSLCRLSYKVAQKFQVSSFIIFTLVSSFIIFAQRKSGTTQRKSGTILDGESRRRESKGTYECCAA